MNGAMINRNLLRSQMALKGITAKALEDAQGWSNTTTYRKINGKSAFTAPEIQVCVELLTLDSETANQIFFCRQNVLKDTNEQKKSDQAARSLNRPGICKRKRNA